MTRWRDGLAGDGDPVPCVCRSPCCVCGDRQRAAAGGVGWWVSHLELDWADPAVRGWWESVSAGYTLVRYDRLGVGMSDRDVGQEDLTLHGDDALLRAVLDELALEKATLVGGSSGGCPASTFAARHPDRVARLLLYGAYADGAAVTKPEVRDALIATVRSHWGSGHGCSRTSSWAPPTAPSWNGSRALIVR